MTLLRRGDLSVTEVCVAGGSSSLGTFSTRFTELVGVPPSTYRRDHSQAARPRRVRGPSGRRPRGHALDHRRAGRSARHLHPPGADPGVTEDERRPILELIAMGAYAAVTLGTDDLDAPFERWSAAGADVGQEPIGQDYGVRDCALRDPAGNLIRVNQLT